MKLCCDAEGVSIVNYGCDENYDRNEDINQEDCDVNIAVEWDKYPV